MEHGDGHRVWTVTAVVTGCPLTAGELRALARLLPGPTRVRVTHDGGDLIVRADVEHVDARSAADRLRRDVPRMLAGFPGRVVTAGATVRGRTGRRLLGHRRLDGIALPGLPTPRRATG